MSGSRRRSIVVVLIVLAMTIPVVPALALVSEACPTTVPSVAFNDLGGQLADAVDAIDCVAYYGIAQGTSSTTFGPNLPVQRWQMALFLVRSAFVLGQTLPSGAAQGFTDISGFDTATQTAINQLKQMGITTGTSATTFGPNGTVPRWQMALFLTRLLVRAGIGLPSGANQGFTDIAGLDANTQVAINQLRQLGIALGTSSTTFAPNTEVARWQMALFLARGVETAGAVAHRITAGLSTNFAQIGDTVVLTITVRNPNGTVSPNRRVDVFVASGLDSNGRCVLDADADIAGGDEATGTNCVLDGNDPQTNSNGVVTLNLTHNATQEIDNIYVWTGEIGDTFDAQDVRGEQALQLTWGPPPTSLNLPASVLARYAGSGSITAQLEGAGGVDIPLANQAIRFVVQRGGTTIVSQTVATGSGGAATLTYTGPADPSGGDDGITTDTVTAFWDRDNDNVDDGAAEFNDTGNLNWDDDLPLATTAQLSQTEVSTLLGVFTTINITVLNKFGQPFSGAEVNFDSAAGIDSAVTNSNGVASSEYTVTVDDGIDSIDAEVDLDGDGDTTEAGDLEFGDVANVTHYWVETAANLSGNTEFDVIAFNAAGNTIDVVEIGATNYYRLTFDSNDQFNTDGTVRNMAGFETDVGGLTLPDLDGGGNTELNTNSYSAGAGAASVFVLETS